MVKRSLLSACLAGALIAGASAAIADGPTDDALLPAPEISGFAAVETRLFFQAPAFAAQHDNRLSPSLTLQPEFNWRWNDGDDEFILVPYARIEPDDGKRTHSDLREALWLHVGDDWELRAGLGKVFWGVAESRHLVDVINQTDLLTDPDQEDKLGQPMVVYTYLSDWGTVDAYLLPGFRERRYPGRQGRLRSGRLVDGRAATYDSAARDKRLDLALRWSHTVGDFDIGLYHFHGTGREPRLIQGTSAGGETVWIPHYDTIDQTGVDLQATKGSWLWKLESIFRTGQQERFAAAVAGFEYTFFGITDTGADLGVLAEYHRDGRHAGAPSTRFDNDLFTGLRLVLNDEWDTDALIGFVADLNGGAWSINVEANRRLTDRLKLELEGGFAWNTPAGTAANDLQRDDYLQLRLAFYL